jgi:hypothetical protein
MCFWHVCRESWGGAFRRSLKKNTQYYAEWWNWGLLTVSQVNPNLVSMEEELKNIVNFSQCWKIFGLGRLKMGVSAHDSL